MTFTFQTRLLKKKELKWIKSDEYRLNGEGYTP